MSIRQRHSDEHVLYFCTFTCFDWLPLFEIVNGYDLVYKWFEYLNTKGHQVVAYVIMPNHVHLILCFPELGFDLNKIISNGKRFMAVGIIKRLKEQGKHELLDMLANKVSHREKEKGQLHKVFRGSFDAKGIVKGPFFKQKLDYIHLNPVRGRWQLADDFTKYPHSSASFYETGKVGFFLPYVVVL